MLLKMYIGNIFLAKTEFDFVEIETETERQLHLERLASVMYWENWQRIKFVAKEPIFYYLRESRMNDFVFGEDPFEGMSWGDIKMHYQLENLKNESSTGE
jgi:hypothetical protein